MFLFSVDFMPALVLLPSNLVCTEGHQQYVVCDVFMSFYDRFCAFSFATICTMPATLDANFLFKTYKVAPTVCTICQNRGAPKYDLTGKICPFSSEEEREKIFQLILSPLHCSLNKMAP
jgi:hypothetical protein